MTSNKYGDRIEVHDTVVVTTNNSKYKGYKGKIVGFHYMSGNTYKPTGVSIRLDVGVSISLSVNSIRPIYNLTPDKVVSKPTPSKELYVVVCKTTNKIIKKDIKEQHANFIANQRISTGASKEILIYRAVKRFTSGVKEEEI